jgi:phage terminase large subunit-like protein
MARKAAQSPQPNMLEGYDPKDPSSLDKVAAKIRELMLICFLLMIPTQERFIRTKNSRGKTPKTRLFEGANQSGKSQIGVAEDLAHAFGFRPWLKQDDPDYKINIQVPNIGLVGCEVAGQTLAQNIEPRFMKFINQFCGPEITRYSDGSIKSLKLNFDCYGSPCGSTIHFRSYVQPAESFEGIIAHWIHWDEPPPKAILNAAERGKMSTNAPSWLTMTPLKEPYIYDIFSLNAFNNGGEDQEIAVFRCSVWENCADWCRGCNVSIPENDSERLNSGELRPINNCPSCGRVMGFMPRAGIDNYLKKITDPDEREAREEGKWKHLSGLVYKELDREKHLYDDFTIPADWMRIEVLDPHDARPCCWLFGAIPPEEIVINGKSANRIYWYTYLRPSGNIESICRQVKVKRAEHNYKEPAMLIIDVKFAAALKPLHGEVQPSWEEELEKAGMKHIVHSCSAPGDVSLGHKRVKEYLQSHYSTVKDKSYPGMLFARNGTKGDGGPMQHMGNYSWKEGTDKPEEAYKDFCDCVRYAALEQPVWKRPEPELDEGFVRMLLDRENMKQPDSILYAGLQMRS